MERIRSRSRTHGPLHAVAYVCFGVGTILMLAMSFGIVRQDLALFLGTSAYVIGGLIWGFADDMPRASDPSRPIVDGMSDGKGSTVSRRAP